MEHEVFYVIKLDSRSWLTSGTGDPPRTLLIENARKYPTHGDAIESLAYYVRNNKHRSFDYAMVMRGGLR